jgi:predicted nucleic acid-binding protein
VGQLTEAIPRGTLVGVDTAAFIYQIECSPVYGEVVGPFFAALARREFRAVTSVISLMEISVRPLRLERPEVADDYEILLLTYPNLVVVDVDRSIARRAAELRAQYRLHPADSLQVATALTAGATIFLTNDRTIERVQGIRVVIIDNHR